MRVLDKNWGHGGPKMFLWSEIIPSLYTAPTTANRRRKSDRPQETRASHRFDIYQQQIFLTFLDLNCVLFTMRSFLKYSYRPILNYSQNLSFFGQKFTKLSILGQLQSKFWKSKPVVVFFRQFYILCVICPYNIWQDFKMDYCRKEPLLLYFQLISIKYEVISEVKYTKVSLVLYML